MSDSVKICEVGLRDGLQNEPNLISLDDKKRLLKSLVDTGLSSIEVASFVNPKLVPQMADAEKMLEASKAFQHVHAQSLVMNEKGYQRAVSVGADELAFVVSCTDEFSQKNAGSSKDEALKSLKKLVSRCKDDGHWCRVYLSVVWHCPYAGFVDEKSVLDLVNQVAAMQPDEVALSDTTGKASPSKVRSICKEVSKSFDASKLALHLHDTSQLALANVAVALDEGIRIFDSAIGGLGGCPFAPGAKGNLATEDLVFLIQSVGMSAGADLNAIWAAVDVASDILGRKVGGRTQRP